MNEFFREVDEEYRRDRIANFWTRYSGAVVALLVILVAGVGGWRYWQHAERQKAEAAAARFQDAVGPTADADAARKTLDELAATGPAGYRTLARFRLAAERGRGSAEEGAAAYEALAGDASLGAPLQDLARLRAALLRLDGAPERALPVLEQLATPTGTYRHTAREALGLAALRRGDAEAAGRWFDQVAADRETPANLRSRLELYAGLAAGGAVQVTQ